MILHRLSLSDLAKSSVEQWFIFFVLNFLLNIFRCSYVNLNKRDGICMCTGTYNDLVIRSNAATNNDDCLDHTEGHIGNSIDDLSV